MEEGNVKFGVLKHVIKWGADELTAANDGDGLILKIDAVASKEPINGGGGGRVKIAIL